MNLYECDDDGCGCCLTWEERTCMVVWANDEAEAKRLYLAAYPEQPVPDGVESRARLRERLPKGVWPLNDTPYVEKRREVERLLGYRYEGEECCRTCDLAPCELEQFALCSKCRQCPECGCVCADEPVIAEAPPTRPGGSTSRAARIAWLPLLSAPPCPHEWSDESEAIRACTLCGRREGVDTLEERA